MDEKSFQELSPVFGSHWIPFQAPVVISKKVYIPPVLVELFHNVNVSVKARTLLSTQISTVLWKIVQEWLQKMHFIWGTFIDWFGGNSSATLQFLSHILKMFLQKLGPSWVLLFEGRQIYQSWVSSCLSVRTSGGKHTRCLPCPSPSQSSKLLLTRYVSVQAVFCSAQREFETERYASQVVTLVLTATLVWYNAVR